MKYHNHLGKLFWSLMIFSLVAVFPLPSRAVTGGTLGVAFDANNPTGSSVSAGNSNVEFMRLILTAQGGDGVATGFNFTVSSTHLSDFAAVKVVDISSGTQVGSTIKLDSNGLGNIGFSLALTANQTKTLAIKADIASSAVSGDTMGIRVTTISYTGFTGVSGLINNQLPSNIMMVGTVFAPNLSVSAGSSPVYASFARKVVDSVLLANFNLSAALNNVSVSSLRLVCVGCSDQTVTGATNDFSSLVLYDGATSTSFSPTVNGNIYDFSFPSGLIINANSIKTVSVKAQVATSANVTTNESFHFELRAITGTIAGENFPVAIGRLPASSPNNTIVPPTIITSGNLNINLDPSTPIGQTLSPGQLGAVFMIFRLQATVGDAYIGGIEISSNANPSDFLSNVQIMDGAISLGSTTSFTLKSGVYVSTISISPLTISAGSYKIFRLVANVSASPKDGSLKLGISNFSFPQAISTPTNVPVYSYPMTFGSGIPGSNNNNQTSVADLKDGDLALDSGTVYILENGLKRPFTSASVFTNLGFKFQNVVKADLGQYVAGAVVSDPTARHPRGTLVLNKGTVYFLGAVQRYPFTAADIFLSWGNKFQNVVPANTADLQLPEGPVVQMKQ